MKLYAVYKDYATRKHVVSEVEAIETKRTYKLKERLPAFGHAVRVEKDDKSVATSPGQAWERYILKSLRALESSRTKYHDCLDDYRQSVLSSKAWYEANDKSPLKTGLAYKESDITKVHPLDVTWEPKS